MSSNDDRFTKWGSVFLAPLTLVFAAALYVAGNIARDRTARAFGLDGAMFGVSLHDTMVSGFLAIVMVALIGLILGSVLIIGWIVGLIWDYFIEKPSGSFSSYAVRATFPTSPFGWAFTVAVVLLVSSIGAGRIAANLTVSNQRNEVDAGCPERCRNYSFGDRTVTGVRIIANADRLAILTAGRIVRVEKMDELSAVTPYLPPLKVRQRVAAPKR